MSFTNSAAFSPTDTLPLTIAAKALMLAQALASLLTIALVAARAVNILSWNGGPRWRPLPGPPGVRRIAPTTLTHYGA